MQAWIISIEFKEHTIERLVSEKQKSKITIDEDLILSDVIYR